jgi:predicted NAD/FAD-binding protein
MYRLVAPEVAHSVTVRNVAVIGTGYVGLTLRASLARRNRQALYTENSLERHGQLAVTGEDRSSPLTPARL